jgi:TetR/AcrR family transcriptional repressor of nem operon
MGKPRAKLGRPPGFDREAAVRTAAGEFWRAGFERTPTTRLADAMGIERSSFYNAFGEREALFEEAVALYASEAPDAILSRIGGDDPIAPALAATLSTLCAARAADPEHKGCLIVNSIAELVGANEKLGPLLERALKQRIELIAGLLDRAKARGELALRADPAIGALAFATLLCGLNLIAKVVHKEEHLAAVAKLLMGAIATSPSQRRMR